MTNSDSGLRPNPLRGDLADVEHLEMRELVMLLRRAQEGSPSLSQREIATRAGVKVSPSTISRWTAATEDRYRRPKSFSRDQQLVLEFLRRHLARQDRPQSPNREIPALAVLESALYDAIKVAIGMTAERIDDLREQMPGDYLVAAFSSSWPRSFTISVLRIEWNDRSQQLVSAEHQVNRDPYKTETYGGVVYGKADMRGIVSFERNQGFVRHYVQEERSPRLGRLQWMKGHLLTASGRQSSFVSPFYLERIPCNDEGYFWEQYQDDESLLYEAEGATGFAIKEFCCVDPLETIASMAVDLVRRFHPASDDGPPNAQLADGPGTRGAPSAAKFLRDFVERCEMHFEEAASQSTYAYSRLTGRPKLEGQFRSLFEAKAAAQVAVGNNTRAQT